MALFPCHRAQEKGQKEKEAEGGEESAHMVLSLKLSWSQDMVGEYKVSFLSSFLPQIPRFLMV